MSIEQTNRTIKIRPVTKARILWAVNKKLKKLNRTPEEIKAAKKKFVNN